MAGSQALFSGNYRLPAFIYLIIPLIRFTVLPSIFLFSLHFLTLADNHQTGEKNLQIFR